MPQIKEYTAEHAEIHPTETGIDALVAGARRVGAFYQQAGEAERRAAQDVARGAEGIVQGTKAFVGSLSSDVKAIGNAFDAAQAYTAHKEISTLAPGMFQATSNLTQAWNGAVGKAAANDPNDPTLQAKFMQETFEPWAQQFVGSATTPEARDWAEGQVAKLRQHFHEKTSADTSSLAGVAATTNLNDSAQAWAQTARSDPSAVPFLLDLSKDYSQTLTQTHPHLSAEMAARVNTEFVSRARQGIVAAGGVGVVENARDPVAAANDYIKRYPEYFDQRSRDALIAAARGAAHVNEQHAAAQQGIARQDAVNDFKTKAGNLQGSVGIDRGSLQLPNDYWSTFKKLAVHPGADADTKQNLYQLGVAVTARAGQPEPAPDVSRATTMDLLNQMHAGRLKPAQIYEAYGAGKLSGADLAMINAKLVAAQSPFGQREALFLKAVAPAITRGLSDEQAQLKMYGLQSAIDRAAADIRKTGKDPAVLFDPSSDRYMGSPQTLSSFRPPLQTQVQEQAAPGFQQRFPQYETKQGASQITQTDTREPPKIVSGPAPATTAAPAATTAAPNRGATNVAPEKRVPTQTFQPPSNWQFSPSRNQYRDPQGRVFDTSGRPVVPMSQ